MWGIGRLVRWWCWLWLWWCWGGWCTQWLMSADYVSRLCQQIMSADHVGGLCLWLMSADYVSVYVSGLRHLFMWAYIIAHAVHRIAPHHMTDVTWLTALKRHVAMCGCPCAHHIASVVTTSPPWWPPWWPPWSCHVVRAVAVAVICHVTTSTLHRSHHPCSPTFL